MPYILTINQRLAGNLFSNRYYLPAELLTDAIVDANQVFQAQRQIQTTDVEYVSMAVTADLAPYATNPIVIATGDSNGQIGGGATSPAITFLEFTFAKMSQRGKVSHRIRGFAANDYSDLGVFNANSRGAGDYDAGTAVATAFAGYSQYLSVVESLTGSPSYGEIVASQRITVGAKRTTRAL